MSAWARELLDVKLLDCLYPLACPHCANATVRASFDGSDWWFNCLAVPPCALRNLVREGYGIKGTYAEDVLIAGFCYPCSNAQMAHEIASRGKLHKPAGGSAAWQQGRWDCLKFPLWFLYALCLPSCAAGSVLAAYDPTKDCVFWSFCGGTALIRNMIREGFGIEGSCLEDYLCMWGCAPCAVVQLHGEVAKRRPHTTPQAKVMR